MALTNLYVQFKQDPEAENLLKQLKDLGYSVDGLKIERVIRLEGSADPEKLLPMFVNPLYQTYSYKSALSPTDGPIVEIGYQRAVTDPETPSIFDGAWAMRVEGLEWARLANRYQFLGSSAQEADRIAKDNLFNPIIQTKIESENPWDSLHPHGIPDPVRQVSLIGHCDMDLLTMSNDNSWYAPISQLRALQAYERKIGRPLTDAEIEITVQSWSDHCYHTTWRSLKLLQKLQAATAKINHPLVVSVFTDNAGGMKFYEDEVILIKGETHNFPSAIATFGGVATKHGGVIRDAIGFGRGGYPIGGSTIMGTMDPRMKAEEVPSGALHPRIILTESIRGTSYYCNPMGIPMMHPVYRIHPGFPKCLALGHTIGIIPEKYALKEDVVVGDSAVLFGGRTGRDGIHGATASSAQMTDESIHKDSTAVQIGLPIIERKFMTAVPFLRDADCLRTITDLGAGGLSCAIGEMGSQTGVRVDLAKVPLKDASLAPWEILLSESQERMLAAIPPEKLDEALEILRRYDVEYAVIGKFTDTHKLTAYHGETLVADLEMPFLWKSCPIDPIEVNEPARPVRPPSTPIPQSPQQFREAIERVLSHYHCCDQSAAGTRFDSTVQGRTVMGPYGGKTGRMRNDAWISAPLRGKPYGVVTTLAFNPFYGGIDPAGMARLSVIEAITKAIAVGVSIDDITLCDNFYTPKIRPEVAWDLKAQVETIAELSEVFGTPFISGKDSSSGTFKSDTGEIIDVPYTLVVGTLCRMPDVTKAVRKPFSGVGNKLVVLGRFDPEKLGGSVYLDAFGDSGGELSDFGQDWAKELMPMYRRIHEICSGPNDPIRSASAIAEGGLLFRAFEASMGSGLGVRLNLPDKGRKDGILFAEAVGALLIELESWMEPDDLFQGLPGFQIGEVTESPDLDITGVLKVPIADLVKVWERPFAEVVR